MPPSFDLPEPEPVQRGVTNVGINGIISERGVAKATLYAHFAIKDELILEFMRQGDARWVA